MTQAIREWGNVEWAPNYTEQNVMQRMAKDILANADTIENKPTPGQSKQDLSRVIVATSNIIASTRYIIHVEGFTVSHITEIVEVA